MQLNKEGLASQMSYPIKYPHSNSLKGIPLMSAEKRDSVTASDWASLLLFLIRILLTGKQGREIFWDKVPPVNCDILVSGYWLGFPATPTLSSISMLPIKSPAKQILILPLDSHS